jgi:Arc/MetJ-type ribon-helix-helix transcriptional regulator
MPMTRKSVSLPDSIWAEINEFRKTFDGRIPSQTEAVRILLQEALDARASGALQTDGTHGRGLERPANRPLGGTHLSGAHH